jgi:hypothetical protein
MNALEKVGVNVIVDFTIFNAIIHCWNLTKFGEPASLHVAIDSCCFTHRNVMIPFDGKDLQIT